MNKVVTGDSSFQGIGIDSCKKTGKYQGWSVFWLDAYGGYGFGVYPSIKDIVAEYSDADSMLIDIPVGLPENEQDNAARPDRELRSRLKGKASSVFNTPCRQAVYCRDKQEAKAVNVQFLRKSLSEQSLGFASKIKEVDLFLAENPQYVDRLRESHPEYVFALLNDGKPLTSKKTERTGVEERKMVLGRYFPQTEKALGEIMVQYPRRLLDDFIDAMVLAVSGLLGMKNGFDTIPKQPQRDRRGLPMEVVYGRI
ncbi:MAG: DUF429 domain-containing protein [Negativicutes bacterium]|nr:DUF429 domain-containing protein [Negativicutes bacterium]